MTKSIQVASAEKLLAVYNIECIFQVINLIACES